MHPGAFEFVGRYATSDAVSVIEIGSRDINGTVRSLFPAASWVGLDLYDGPSVDWAGDAVNYFPSALVDLVICCEVLEHASNWRELIHVAGSWLSPGGWLIVTCAGAGREPHSHHDGRELRDGEYYGNLSADQLAEELHFAGFSEIEASGNEHWHDTYARAMKA